MKKKKKKKKKKKSACKASINTTIPFPSFE